MKHPSDYNAGPGELQVRDARTDKRFFMDNVILRGYGPTLGVYGISVYSALCMHANLGTQQGYPSHQTIADLLDCSVGKVKDSLRLLEKLELIHSEPRYEPETRRQTSNLYTILAPPVPPVTTDTPPRNAEMTTNNPNLDQSYLKKEGEGAIAPHAPAEDWPTEPAAQEPPPNPAQTRIERMRSVFGADPLTVAAHCAERQAAEGTWTVPEHRGLSPACAVFKDATGYAPPRGEWRDRIDEHVGDGLGDLERWHIVCVEYVGCGWSPRNVKGMLDFYVLGQIPTTKPEGKGNGGASTGRREQTVTESPSDPNSLAAAFDRIFDETGMRRDRVRQPAAS